MAVESWLKEYTVTLSPDINGAAWAKATGSITAMLAKAHKKAEDLSVARKLITQTDLEIKALQANLTRLQSSLERAKDDEEADKIKKQIDAAQAAMNKQVEIQNKALTTQTKLTSGVGAAAVGISKFASATGTAINVMSSVIEVAKDIYAKGTAIADTAADFSTKFITGESAFTDDATKEIMAKFGVGATEAQAINAALGSTGYELSDIATFTKGEAEFFQSQIDLYTESINSIDPNKLSNLNAVSQEYLKLKSEVELKLQTNLIDLLSSSKQLPQLMDSLGSGLGAITDLLTSPAVQAGFEVFTWTLKTVIDLLTLPIKLITGEFGNNKSGDTYNVSVQTNVDGYTKNSTTSNTKKLDNQGVDLGLLIDSAVS